MREPLDEAIRSFLQRRSEATGGGLGHVSPSTQIDADKLATSPVWSAEVLIIEGHGHWARPSTVLLAGKRTNDSSARAWPDVLPRHIGLKALILGACNSGERPVKDAIRSRLQPGQMLPVLASRGTARTWQGYLIYFLALVRLDQLPVTAWANPTQIELALDQALLDAQHVWTNDVGKPVRRNKALDLGDYPMKDAAVASLKRHALRALSPEERSRERSTDEWIGWGVHLLHHDAGAVQW